MDLIFKFSVVAAGLWCKFGLIGTTRMVAKY